MRLAAYCADGCWNTRLPALVQALISDVVSIQFIVGKLADERRLDISMYSLSTADSIYSIILSISPHSSAFSASTL